MEFGIFKALARRSDDSFHFVLLVVEQRRLVRLPLVCYSGGSFHKLSAVRVRSLALTANNFRGPLERGRPGALACVVQYEHTTAAHTQQLLRNKRSISPAPSEHSFPPFGSSSHPNLSAHRRCTSDSHNTSSSSEWPFLFAKSVIAQHDRVPTEAVQPPQLSEQPSGPTSQHAGIHTVRRRIGTMDARWII